MLLVYKLKIIIYVGTLQRFGLEQKASRPFVSSFFMLCIVKLTYKCRDEEIVCVCVCVPCFCVSHVAYVQRWCCFPHFVVFDVRNSFIVRRLGVTQPLTLVSGNETRTTSRLMVMCRIPKRSTKHRYHPRIYFSGVILTPKNYL